jgi:hypothetical protein
VLADSCGGSDVIGVEAVRRRDQNDVDVGIGEQSGVVVIRARRTVLRGERVGPTLVAARDRVQAAMGMRGNRGGQTGPRDMTDTDDAPVDRQGSRGGGSSG